MQDRRPVRGVVLSHIGEVEPLRGVVVELDRSELPLAADAVGHVEVDLRTVKRPFALLDLERPSQPLQRAAQEALGAVPELIGPDALLGSGRELRGVLEPHR